MRDIMYAIVEIGAKQYKVEKGMTVDVEKVNVGEQKSLVLDKVLLVADGDSVTVGTPYVAKASVKATVVNEHKGKKVLGMIFRKRKDSYKTFGQRPVFLELKIDEVNA